MGWLLKRTSRKSTVLANLILSSDDIHSDNVPATLPWLPEVTDKVKTEQFSCDPLGLRNKVQGQRNKPPKITVTLTLTVRVPILHGVPTYNFCLEKTAHNA